MNSLEFQKILDNAWKELIIKRKADKIYEEGAKVKAHNKYWFTLNQGNLPGVIINLEKVYDIFQHYFLMYIF